MTLRPVALLALAGCVVQYTIGPADTDTTTCPEGQAPCTTGDPPTTTAPCGDGLVACGDQCTTPAACACDCDPDLEVCADAGCACRPGLTRCGPTCVDLRTDPLHCDACETSCNGGVCQAGTCREGCAGDLADCDGACVQLKTDSLHCGDCATLCAPEEACIAGTCQPYVPAGECDACPCPACDQAEAAPVCCPAPFLGAPVCVAGPCTGE